MVELKYVKKRKRRKRVAIGTGICLSGITILGIIAFLGRNTGTFTVALDSGNVSMSLSKSESFENPTSFLRVDGLQHLEQSTYSDQDASELDNENSNGKDFSRCLFKLTFFIKNMAPIEDSAIKYYLNVNMIENHKTTDMTLSRMLGRATRSLGTMTVTPSKTRTETIFGRKGFPFPTRN